MIIPFKELLWVGGITCDERSVLLQVEMWLGERRKESQTFDQTAMTDTIIRN